MSYQNFLIAIALTRQPYIPGLKAQGFTADFHNGLSRVSSGFLVHQRTPSIRYHIPNRP